MNGKIAREHMDVLKKTTTVMNKMVYGGSNGNFAMRKMMQRDMEENAKLYAEAKEMRIQARVRNAFVPCKCGKKKNPKYFECWDCLQERRKKAQNGN